MINAQEWLDENYPLERRKNIIELDIKNKNLDGYLKLEEFNNLKRFWCSGNRFTNLSVSNCTRLEELDCSDNRLDSLDLRKCDNLRELNCSFNNLTNLDYSFNASNLFSLNIVNNNFLEQDLSVFSHLINLKLLWIGNDDEEK